MSIAAPPFLTASRKPTSTIWMSLSFAAVISLFFFSSTAASTDTSSYRNNYADAYVLIQALIDEGPDLQTVVRPILLCGCETWPMTARDEKRMAKTEVRMVRWDIEGTSEK